MTENRKSYRIRTGVGNEAPSSINVDLTQTYDIIDVLSLELDQKNFYKMPSAGYGVIIGRVIANDGFGIPNAKVSVFIPYDRNSLVDGENVLYHYTTPMSKGVEGIRYNLLPRHLDDECHQNVGTMYEKEYLLDNKDIIQVFDKYYKYTTVTNKAGDYFIYGVPVGTQTVHVDLDLSDIGVLSQRPRDMMYKGFGADMFDSPNKFKKSENLNELPQIYSQDNVVNVYPFWGDTSVDETNGVITRCDINIDYAFEPTCVFIGSIVSDTANRAISQRCVPDDEIGKMSDLIAGEGKIEMIRKTFDGKVEEFQIRSNNLIDGDGVWCYQIPMNLDYVVTDEFGNIVPTDNPSKGIPTRTRVRFRMSMNETITDDTARKRARFLVPNNPRLTDEYPDFMKTHEADYEFGTFTKEESYRDLFWNKVYTVKSYIPRLQKAKALRRRVHTGIKNVNHSGANNPFPFNNLFIRLTFTYRFLCTLMTLFCTVVYGLNTVLGLIGAALYWVARGLHGIWDVTIPIINIQPFKEWCFLERGAKALLEACQNITVKLDNFCDDGNFDNPTYVPIPVNHPWMALMREAYTPGSEKQIYIEGSCLENDEPYQFPEGDRLNIEPNLGRLFNCIENQLAQDQECTSFNFSNDWVNGVLYAPLWYRKIRSKKRIFFNLIPVKAKDKWCSANSTKLAKGLSLCQTCAQKRSIVSNKTKINPLPYENMTRPYHPNEDNCYGYKCHKKSVSFVNVEKGLIVPIETLYGDTVYYYKSVEYDNSNLHAQNGLGMGDVKILFATDIVLLGSLNDCDAEGVPQFFKRLESTTYNMPPDLVQLDYDSNAAKLEFEKKTAAGSSAMSEMGFGDNGLSDIEDEIDESKAIEPEDVYTDKTGADWGNFGQDQVTADYKNNYGYIFSTSDTNTPYSEFPDVGGLFYGLTCWSAYTKPKSCVNISRVCEYGVSLDETQENPVYGRLLTDDEAYEHMAPDGFISYDELYDKDGRAMFATMNSNNLRTKTNPNNGFLTYDFMFLYPENFDGVMKNLMNPVVSPPLYPTPQNNNFKAEDSSEAYLRFRYGRNRNDRTIDYYYSNTKIGLYPNSENKNRFPKYENSFYFYFGLNPGKTAIDKFRTQYYSECKDSEGEQDVVGIEFSGNEWCSEILDNGAVTPGDGWFKLDATYVEAPYNVYFANLDGNTEYDVWCNGVVEPKVYFSYVGEIVEFEAEGYVRKQLYRNVGNHIEEYGLMNDTYRIIITNANGDEYRRTIEFTAPKIMASLGRSPFRMKNDDLRHDSELSHGDFYNNVATLGGKEGEDMSSRSRIGGFIEVKNINVDGSKLVDFIVEITPSFDMNTITASHVINTERSVNNIPIPTPTAYTGTRLEIHQHQDNETHVPYNICEDNTLMRENFQEINPYCPYGYDYPQYPIDALSPDMVHQTNGGNYDFRFGVPLGGKKYNVKITMLCKNGERYYRSRNYVSFIIEVPEPLKFRMLINGVDYEIIRNFGLLREVPEESGEFYYGTGWQLLENGLPFPENYTVGNDFKDYLIGWDEIDNIDGLETLDAIPEGTENFEEWNYENYIKVTEAKLTNTYSESTTKYNWVGDYQFDTEVVFDMIGKYETVPLTRQSGCAFITVNENGEYVFYKWVVNGDTGVYQKYMPDGIPVTVITTQEYYDESDIDIKNNYISMLNNVIEIRKMFVANVKNAFVMRSDEAYSLDVRSVTNEVPVKTLIYWMQDTDTGTSEEFVPLDEEFKVETECYGITVPTLTGVISNENGFIWRGDDSSDLRFLGNLWLQPLIGGYGYKKPYLVAVQNALEETLPENIEGGVDGNMDNVSRGMFGVHMLEKRLRFRYNNWAMAYEWPNYLERQSNQGSSSGLYIPKTITVPGLFAGFILDGTPEYGGGYYPETYFEKQALDNTPFNLNTLTVGQGGYDVEEWRFPVVRLITGSEADLTTYADYRYFDTVFNGMLSVIGLDGLTHMTYTNKYAQIMVQDDESSVNLPLYDEVGYPSLSYKIQDNLYVVEATFAEGWYYTFYEGTKNPVYTKAANGGATCMKFTDPYLNTIGTGEMFFDDTHFNMYPGMSYGKVYYLPGGTSPMPIWELQVNDNVFKKLCRKTTVSGCNCIPITTIYGVRISHDKQRRTISKTFDLTPMEYYVTVEPEIDAVSELVKTNIQHSIVLNLNIGVRTENNPDYVSEGFYYLKKHNFSVEFLNTDESGETNVVRNIEIEDGYDKPSVDIEPNSYTKWAKIIFETYEIGSSSVLITDLEHQLNNSELIDAYLTDVTGVRHKMKGQQNGFNNSYILLNE